MMVNHGSDESMKFLNGDYAGMGFNLFFII